jgi:hypothetical protein
MLAILDNNLANVPKEKLGLRPVFWRWQKVSIRFIRCIEAISLVRSISC